jgi:hypothetical protein
MRDRSWLQISDEGRRLRRPADEPTSRLLVTLFNLCKIFGIFALVTVVAMLGKVE